MITANFFHIKSTNGLFFYGLDYLRENLDQVRMVLVPSALENRTKLALPEVAVVPCSAGRYLREVTLAWWRKDLLFTPTSHPLPFISHQWVVLHDAYPFEVGRGSRLKRILFQLSLNLSRCRVGYINRSEARSFVVSLGVSSERMVFTPNRFPEPFCRLSPMASPAGLVTVGLMGTDSAKKNYERLFRAVQGAGLSSQLVFRVYGHDNAYFHAIRAQFAKLQIDLVRSDEESMADFMNGIDVLVSAAEQEGFGRPIASALLAGLPVELLDRPVFREFFSGGARFHTNIDALVNALPRSRAEVMPTSYIPPADVIAAYFEANAEIRRSSFVGRS